jgi:hypothetical protein
VRPDGRVDLSKMPAMVPLLDEEGRVVGNVDPDTYVNAVVDGETETTGSKPTAGG